MGSFLGRVTARRKESPAPTTTRSTTSATIGRNWSAYWFSHTYLRACTFIHPVSHRISGGTVLDPGRRP